MDLEKDLAVILCQHFNCFFYIYVIRIFGCIFYRGTDFFFFSSTLTEMITLDYFSERNKKYVFPSQIII